MSSELSDAATRARPIDPIVLDDAFDRMGATDFELANGFVNHGPMACEALAALGCEDEIDGWARRFVRMVGAGPTAVEPGVTGGDGWRDELGDYRLLPEWIGYFDRAIADTGWASVVGLWVPRLVPGLVTALFHGAIRTAHAVRAIDAVDNESRRAELARALGYWAARFHPGQPVTGVGAGAEAASALVTAAANGARHFAATPGIVALHGVTGAMAVELLLPHVASEAGLRAVAQVEAEHAELYGSTTPDTTIDATAGGWDDSWGRAAATSGDAHEVKLVEACRRGWAATGDRSFVAAARVVTGGR